MVESFTINHGMFVRTCCVLKPSCFLYWICVSYVECVLYLSCFVWLWAFHVYCICVGNVFRFGLFQWIYITTICWPIRGLHIYYHMIFNIPHIVGWHARSLYVFQWELQTIANIHINHVKPIHTQTIIGFVLTWALH